MVKITIGGKEYKVIDACTQLDSDTDGEPVGTEYFVITLQTYGENLVTMKIDRKDMKKIRKWLKETKV